MKVLIDFKGGPLDGESVEVDTTIPQTSWPFSFLKAAVLLEAERSRNEFPVGHRLTIRSLGQTNKTVVRRPAPGTRILTEWHVFIYEIADRLPGQDEILLVASFVEQKHIVLRASEDEEGDRVLKEIERLDTEIMILKDQHKK